ncbi:hypothetical protein [Xanthomonas citri]|uniref:hypothetical protein n=1 Tax=Xanthomonas citri TaxID=346 RepID=UPI003FA29764
MAEGQCRVSECYLPSLTNFEKDTNLPGGAYLIAAHHIGVALAFGGSGLPPQDADWIDLRDHGWEALFIMLRTRLAELAAGNKAFGPTPTPKD